jgi:hypothetical protein
MDMNNLRRVRIEGKHDETTGYMMEVYDADTGKSIPLVRRVVVTLDAASENQAEITYYETGEDGHLIKVDGQSIEKTVMVSNPEIAVTAFEVNHGR